VIDGADVGQCVQGVFNSTGGGMRQRSLAEKRVATADLIEIINALVGIISEN